MSTPHLKTVMDSVAWLACLASAAAATQGLRSAKTLSDLADELYVEWSARRGHAHAP